ncbi:Sec-independent protein translocase TatA [Streptomyces sp. S3(2020)]|uniref:twin-arginine translocase TatA/TatE family subunit n=1 Tax=Streptomyces sp. S3(2020) TaxID=2732044 RepID=UPI001489A9DB|nr:twin-arginine translocase TatA/TatE family subunit [Streptomyces sp. S3(2020)]NNN30942.1 Sec-independent protein translocase TatA [Streptomyces sp. S3(2020)]
MFGLSEIALILIVIIVVVGIKKLPELTRSAGKAARIFKSEAKALKEQDASDAQSGPGRVVQDTTAEKEDPSARP